MDENQDAVIRLYASEPSPNSISSAIQLAVRPAAISSLPEISKAGGGFVPRKIKKTRPYHGNIDGLCRRRYPSLYKEKKKEDRTENKSRNFQESISEKQSRKRGILPDVLLHPCLFQKLFVGNSISGKSCCLIHSARNFKSRKAGAPSG